MSERQRPRGKRQRQRQRHRQRWPVLSLVPCPGFSPASPSLAPTWSRMVFALWWIPTSLTELFSLGLRASWWILAWFLFRRLLPSDGCSFSISRCGWGFFPVARPSDPDIVPWIDGDDGASCAEVRWRARSARHVWTGPNGVLRVSLFLLACVEPRGRLCAWVVFIWHGGPRVVRELIWFFRGFHVESNCDSRLMIVFSCRFQPFLVFGWYCSLFWFFSLWQSPVRLPRSSAAWLEVAMIFPVRLMILSMRLWICSVSSRGFSLRLLGEENWADLVFLCKDLVLVSAWTIVGFFMFWCVSSLLRHPDLFWSFRPIGCAQNWWTNEKIKKPTKTSDKQGPRTMQGGKTRDGTPESFDFFFGLKKNRYGDEEKW